MLGSFGSKLMDAGHRETQTASPPPKSSTPEAIVPASRPPVERTTKAEVISTFGPGLSVVGKISSDHAMQIFGKVEGELRASQVLIGDGAEVNGNVFAQDLTVRGYVKGTIRAVRVKLQGNGAIDGDIFHRALSIEENASFEGSSHRMDDPLETTKGEAMATPRQNLQSRVSPHSNGQEAVAVIGRNSDLEQAPP